MKISRGRHCDRSGHCAFAHSEKELRTPQDKTTLSYHARYQEWDTLLDKIRTDRDIHIDDPNRDTKATALHYAAKYSNITVVQELLNLGASVHAKDFRGYTPLHTCAAFCAPNNVETANILIDAGAKLDATDNRGNNPAAVCQRFNDALINLLTGGQGLPPPSDEKLAAMAKRKASASTRINDTQNKRVRLEGEDIRLRREVNNNNNNNNSDDNANIVTEEETICVKCKFEGKVKMFKATIKMDTKELIKQILIKFELTDENSFSSDVSNYRLNYFDDANDNIELENRDDLQLFLISPTVTNKLLYVTKQTQ